ncbi:MAG: cadherin-like beta sandwich domain-containing protein [Lachnospiraceae bacterium]
MKNHIIHRVVAVIMTVALIVTCFPGSCFQTETVVADSVTYGYVDVTSSLNVRKGAGTSYGLMTDSNGKSISLYGNQKVTIISKSGNWYKVSFTYNGATYTGYVSADYVNIYDGTYDESYAASLKKAGFPDSYIPALCYLHSKHPNWVFTPYKTNLDWSTAVTEESKLGRSLIPISSPSSWLSTESGAYNWGTDTYTEYDSGGWGAASKELVEYYLDPRNFLSENGIFMFEKLTYHSDYHTVEGVQNILNGTFMSGTYDGTHTYASLFVEAGVKYGVSPFTLAARVKQEQGTAGTSGSISGTYSGYEGYYNFFNIGAYKTSTMSAIERGLWYASQTDAATLRPWNTKYKSIMGGSQILASQYINKGQDTLYLQRFNVTPTNTYGHQYMTNVQAAASEASHQRAAYSNVELPIEFSIPVFNNMTDEPVGRPTAYGNPNYNLKTMTISKGTLTPSFSYNTTSYSAVVDNSVTSVTVSATAVSSKATITGTGTKSLNVGNNVFSIVVTAENGTKKTYKITINRKAAAATPTPTPAVTGGVTPTPAVTGGATHTPTPTPTKVPESVTSSVYTVTKSYIVGVDPKTTVSQFLGNLNIKGSNTKNVVNASGTVQGSSAVIATGYSLKTDGLTYIICVKGDVYGDGTVNVKDLLYVKKNILGNQTLNQAQTYAACVSGSSAPGIKDLLIIKKYILGYINKF